MNIIKLFKGRLNRRNWAYGLLSFIGVYTLFLLLFIVPIYNSNADTANYWSTFPIGNLIVIFFVLSALIFNVSLHIRRLHDIGKSGWFLLLLPLPVINLFVFAYLAFEKGEDGDNKFGEKPSKEIEYPNQILKIGSNKSVNILGIFVGKFPNNEKLDQKWWHRLAKIFAIILSITFYLYVIVALETIAQQPENIIYAIILFILGRFLPGLFYRLVLFVAFNESWKTASRK